MQARYRAAECGEGSRDWQQRRVVSAVPLDQSEHVWTHGPEDGPTQSSNEASHRFMHRSSHLLFIDFYNLYVFACFILHFIYFYISYGCWFLHCCFGSDRPFRPGMLPLQHLLKATSQLGAWSCVATFQKCGGDPKAAPQSLIASGPEIFQTRLPVLKTCVYNIILYYICI